MPLSVQLMVTCLMISSKHWLWSSSLMAHIPLSLACLYIRRSSNSFCSLATSSLEEADWLTYWTYFLWLSVHSLGERMVFRMSSTEGLCSRLFLLAFWVLFTFRGLLSTSIGYSYWINDSLWSCTCSSCWLFESISLSINYN